MTRVNIGDRPAGQIATEALYKTADLFHSDSPSAAKLLKDSTYVDDILDSISNRNTAEVLSKEAEEMLLKGGFHIKFWQFSGKKLISKQVKDTTAVLGVSWKPMEDVITFKASINFSRKKQGAHTGPDLKYSDIPHSIPLPLTKRMVLSQVMKIYDPLGLLCPFTLYGKIYLRETWALKLGWDVALPDNLREKWIRFFRLLFDIEKIIYPRCIKPNNAVGDPWLLILSDGSDTAYGFAAYARWKLKDDSFTCKLIFAKCRIAPLNKVSTPQMELNAAVLSKRGRQVVEGEMRYRFERILHIVDSETVLCMINKTSTRFKLYYGVRLGEIQSATSGDVSCWSWMSGVNNTADWLTRGKTPTELGPESEWWNGPEILSKPIEEWGLKFGRQHDEILPGEKNVGISVNSNQSEIIANSSLIDYQRFSSVETVRWVIARILSILRKKSFLGGRMDQIKPNVLREAEMIIVRSVQNDLLKDMQKTDRKGRSGGRYSALHPKRRKDGIWVVGLRLCYNPMTPDGQPQILLPSGNYVTKLFMTEAHCLSGHKGRDTTLARFRYKYWTPHASKIAWSVRSKCQKCKIRDHELLSQQMGVIPECRLKPSPPFSSTMVDLFGPYSIRGEVQKRVTGKAYGVIFTDMVMRAVHIEAVFGYDTDSFLMALSRFGNLRGYPSYMYSDPGSQLVGADKELQEAWCNIDQPAIKRKCAENGMEWIFGPADSPWYQGAVESLIKGVKRSLKISIGNKRLSLPEFLTALTEIANLMNERPIGIRPGLDSPIQLLTPNCLLMGRCTAKNPGGWQPDSGNLITRFEIVQSVVKEFWHNWRELYAPSLVWDQKWHTSTRNLEVGDVVLISESNALRGEYRLGRVTEVFPSSDGLVRKVNLAYKNFKIGEKVYEYHGTPDTIVNRSVRKLSLIVPVTDIDDCT